MAVRADIRYVAYYIVRELGLGTFVPVTVSAGSTTMRVLNAEMFEPAGGQCIIEATDNLVTYTAVQDDVLTGIPASSTGSIADDVDPYTEDQPSLIYLPELITTDELETVIDRYRVWRAIECLPNETYTKYFCERGWLGNEDETPAATVELRDDDGQTYAVVSEDDRDSETGEFEFDSAQTYDVLYAVGWFYNPFASIADVVDSLIRSERWHRYSQVGQLTHSKKDALEVSAHWRKKASVLNFIT